MRRALSWLPAAIWAGVLFWLSSRPTGPSIPIWFLTYDKATHAMAFGFLAALAYFALRAGHGFLPSLSALCAWLLSSFYGGADELHQAFVPARQPDWHDWLADTIGAALAVAFLLAAERVTRIGVSRRGQRRRSPATGGAV
jgi:VanZ family protein